MLRVRDNPCRGGNRNKTVHVLRYVTESQHKSAMRTKQKDGSYVTCCIYGYQFDDLFAAV